MVLRDVVFVNPTKSTGNGVLSTKKPAEAQASTTSWKRLNTGDG